jgi:hypothetical protein
VTQVEQQNLSFDIHRRRIWVALLLVEEVPAGNRRGRLDRHGQTHKKRPPMPASKRALM